jgi:hypothetical protein
MFYDKVGQQIPVLRLWGALVVQPPPFCNSHGFATERVFFHQARTIELLLES